MADIGTARHVAGSAISLQGIPAQPRTPRALVAGAAACLAAALVLLGARLFAFETVVTSAAALLSTDGVVETANRSALSAVLLAAAVLAVIAAALLLALSFPAWRAAIDAVVTWDPLRALGRDVPNAYLVLASSATIGPLLVGMHLVGSRLGGPIGPLFQKEGLFELVTVALALAGAIWSAAAALRWNKHGKSLLRQAPVLYAALAAALFLFAMEEINWGQTLFEFETPPAWAAINYQEQTSLHNLIDAPALELAERVLVVVFGLSVAALIVLAFVFPHSAFAGIAPPMSLVALAALCAIPGTYLRLEVTELLLALFFAFYGYRLYVAARSPKPAAG